MKAQETDLSEQGDPQVIDKVSKVGPQPLNEEPQAIAKPEPGRLQASTEQEPEDPQATAE